MAVTRLHTTVEYLPVVRGEDTPLAEESFLIHMGVMQSDESGGCEHMLREAADG